MAATTEGKIATLLLAEVEEAFSGVYGIAYQGGTFKPGNDPYLDVSILPNGFAWEGIDKGSTYRGIMQVSAMYPENEGIIKPMEMAGEVAKVFASGRQLAADGVTVVISQKPVVQGGFKDGRFIKVPVSIYYQSSNLED